MDKACPYYVEQFNLQRIMVYENSTYSEAIKKWSAVNHAFSTYDMAALAKSRPRNSYRKKCHPRSVKVHLQQSVRYHKIL